MLGRLLYIYIFLKTNSVSLSSSPAAKPAPAQGEQQFMNHSHIFFLTFYYKAEKKQEDMLGDTIDPQMVDVLLALAEQEEVLKNKQITYTVFSHS